MYNKKLYQLNELAACIFHDIETVPEVEKFIDLPIQRQKDWIDKYHVKYLKKEIENTKKEIYLNQIHEGLDMVYNTPDEVVLKAFPDVQEIYTRYSPLHAEFGKIFCITIGLLDTENNNNIELETYYNKDEKVLLQEFKTLLNNPSLEDFKLAGFNSDTFDIPFIIKRMLINGMPLPEKLQIRGKKPWEINTIDICKDWSSGNWGDTVGLHILCITLGLKSPKTAFQNYEMNIMLMKGEITPKDVCSYCERDVTQTILVALKLV